MEAEPWRVERLQINAEYMRFKLNDSGFDTGASLTQIIPVIVGEPSKAVKASRKLLESGFFIQAIRPPTVPEGTSRLRLTVSALHTEGDLKRAASAIKDVFKGL